MSLVDSDQTYRARRVWHDVLTHGHRCGLHRQFQASGPNRTWVADLTCLWTAEGWLDVAVVLDLYSRRAVGWSIHKPG